MKYIIQGGRKLEGEIEVSGNKNAIFPCVAAALLTQDEVILENVADLADTQVLIQILNSLGVKVDRRKTTLVINSKDLKSYVLPKEFDTDMQQKLISKMFYLFAFPGGDIIGKRSINTHLEAFKSIGAVLTKSDLEYSLRFVEQENTAVSIFLQEASVTACENLILASVLGKKKVVLKNCPKEPHVEDLCKMLLQMGASIKGVGTDTLLIDGVDKLSGTKFKIGIDYIEVGTYAVASAITGGKIKIFGLDKSNLDPVLEPLKRFGVKIETHDNYLVVSADKLISPVKIITNIWPGFPSDLMSVAIVLATQSKGVTLCHDWMYESRMFFVDKLISMGAQITLADPHRSLVYGSSKLKGRVIETPDIRAGMALVLAALVAKGESTINQIELIERGYENVVGKLTNLGADIKKYV
ncbi:MAG: UDP-N-acetylglucosamine 1-carboxyvinyltransferase [Candidatus Daviesbacteria bacterium GW2011_GWF2_38_6]|uniref:UDP-N-acetylglucosamine 1-carboxyvinyltransferase n=1 Tax=Candidatus Daviesbacteria bacterium GW2011_GWF2_38_6 TaxID=1618432 RepID=A0A0G0MXV6_9BACT|nr:MAG: UDP-N-acetylglucosamine 1-carboxyvinyltransferase [Candidatus Daviesbacteria bacterium GW2011_GWF2_38_6]